jgi:hypothetical protein
LLHEKEKEKKGEITLIGGKGKRMGVIVAGEKKRPSDDVAGLNMEVDNFLERLMV